MEIKQGDVYWLKVSDRISHPHVVIEVSYSTTLLSTDQIKVCALTTNMKKANMPGNVLVEAGEANLTRTSIVEVSKAKFIQKSELGDYIGRIGADRISEILAGIDFIERLSGYSRNA